MNGYLCKYEVHMSDLDMWGNMRCSKLLALFQDMADAHSYACGVSSTQVKAAGSNWVVARMWVKLRRPIREGDVLSITTGPRPLRGIQFVRDFEIADSSGDLIGEAVSIWVLTDVKTREFLGPETVKSLVGTAVDVSNKTLKMPNLKAPAQREYADEHTFKYSETDINGHVNNTRYLDVVCDAYHMEEKPGKYVCELQISYKSECLPGEKIELYHASDGEYDYIVGMTEKKLKFETKIMLADI